MTTKENNKLIAEFMGYEEQTDPSKRWLNQFFDPKTGKRHVYLFFDLSYDWLMPVVEEIERNHTYFNQELQLKITKYSVKWQTITGESLIISENVFSNYGTYAGTEKLQAVYNCVLDFINWKNKQ